MNDTTAPGPADAAGPRGTPYFRELADRLRLHGMSEERTGALLAELAGYTAESGADPGTEFGPAPEFAEQLAARGETVSEPEADAEHWVWACDSYADRRLLNRFGQDGWELERMDRLGRFVCHRAPERPMRWEYRREFAKRKDRAATERALAPEGWEPCGHWADLAYFKRPLAAVVGPAAELAETPEVPERRAYYTRRTGVLLTLGAVSWAAAVVLLFFFGADPSVWASMLAGGVGGGLAGFLMTRKEHRKGVSGHIRGVTDGA